MSEVVLIISRDEFLFVVFEKILGSAKPVPMLSSWRFRSLIIYTGQDENISEVEDP